MNSGKRKSLEIFSELGGDFHKFIRKNTWILAIEIAVIWVILAFFLPGGDDLYRYYLPFQQGCDTCGFVPLFARWFLWILEILPTYPLTWGIWVLISVIALLFLTKQTKVNPFLFMVSFPLLGQLWLGQIDWIVASGILLLLYAKNHFWRGFGILVALIKPQLTVLAIIAILSQEKPRNILRMLSVPLVAFLVSLPVFGSTWFLSWFENALAFVPVHQWRMAGLDIWHYGVFFIWVPFIFKEPNQRAAASFMVSSIATSFFGVYSYILFLLFVLPWWAVPLSYLWVLAGYWQGENAMRFAWVLPLILLAWITYKAYKEKKLFIFSPSNG